MLVVSDRFPGFGCSGIPSRFCWDSRISPSVSDDARHANHFEHHRHHQYSMPNTYEYYHKHSASNVQFEEKTLTTEIFESIERSKHLIPKLFIVSDSRSSFDIRSRNSIFTSTTATCFHRVILIIGPVQLLHSILHLIDRVIQS